ncbi:DNA topoisomerase IV [Cellvibrio sp. UBA7661]|uniref:DNA topoisomerase IV n=1 Tax=Cellvibrio sp. UBA7661 TaxID=1946311 RepID=UPI002F35DB78
MKKMNPTHKKNRLACVLAACMVAPLVQAADVNVTGFLSVGGGFVDDEYEDAANYGGYEEDLTFDNNLLGLQVSGQVSEKLTATAQLIARSNSDYDVNAEWAYLTWQATDEVKLRAGRLRTPFYLYSDFLDVGYAYSWITPPREVYYLPFNNVDGIDIYATKTLGIFDATFQAYFGSFNDEFSLDGVQTEAETRNQAGIAATLGKDWWTLRAAYHQADLTVDVAGAVLDPATGFTLGQFLGSLPPTLGGVTTNVLVDEDKATFTQIGITIDTGTFVAAAEHVEFEAKDSMLAKNVREYVMAGVRTGNWLFHITAARSDDDAANLAEGIPVAPATLPIIGALNQVAASQADKRDVISLGTRWDVTSGSALKFQIDDVDDEVNGGQKVYSVALQTVF